jgi:hypothetical protein
MPHSIMMKRSPVQQTMFHQHQQMDSIVKLFDILQNFYDQLFLLAQKASVSRCQYLTCIKHSSVISEIPCDPK